MKLRKVGPIILPTEYGVFEVRGYETGDGTVNLLLTVPHPKDVEVPLVRVHSACLFGEGFAGLDCDCGPQLHTSMERVQAEQCGAIVYLPQEGRGAGLFNKIRAMRIEQLFKRDTVEAYERLHLEIDSRQYKVAALILKDLGYTRIRLLSNSPQKLSGLSNEGIHVVERIGIPATLNRYNTNELMTKIKKLGHSISFQEEHD